MKPFKNPSWWTTEDEGGWERVKAPLKRRWDESQHDLKERRFANAGRATISGHGEPVYDLEPACRFGYGARLHYGGKQPTWNDDLEKCLRADWITLYPSRAENWENDLTAIRFGWNYNEMVKGDAEDSGNYQSIDRRPLEQSHQFYEANSRQH